MNKYYKEVSNGYISSIGISENGYQPFIEIDLAEYTEIKQALSDIPDAPEGFFYRVKEDLSYELVAEEEPTDNITLEEYNDALQTVADYEAQEGGDTL